MGACSFGFVLLTHDLKSAFQNYVEKKREENGHQYGYTFNKTSFKEIILPEINTETKLNKFINNELERENGRYNDKYDPIAYCIKLPKKFKVSVQELCGSEEVKRAKTDNGKKVWENVFYVKNNSGKVVLEKKTRTEAVKAAKEYVSKTGTAVYVEEGKKLQSGSAEIMRLEPKFKTVKKDAYEYHFFGYHPE